MLADLVPGALDVWHGALVDRMSIRFHKLQKHRAVQLLSVQHLRLDLLEDSTSQVADLLGKLRSESILLNRLQVLQVNLILNWSDQSKTVPIFEKDLNHASDLVLLLNGI